jgi:hypothetical protein
MVMMPRPANALSLTQLGHLCAGCRLYARESATGNSAAVEVFLGRTVRVRRYTSDARLPADFDVCAYYEEESCVLALAAGWSRPAFTTDAAEGGAGDEASGEADPMMQRIQAITLLGHVLGAPNLNMLFDEHRISLALGGPDVSSTEFTCRPWTVRELRPSGAGPESEHRILTVLQHESW